MYTATAKALKGQWYMEQEVLPLHTMPHNLKVLIMTVHLIMSPGIELLISAIIN